MKYELSEQESVKSLFDGGGLDLPTPGLPNMSSQTFRCGDQRGLSLRVRPIITRSYKK